MSEGNYLRKSRKNFYLSEDGRYLIERLSRRLGLSEGAVIEVAVREMHLRRLGEFEWDEPEDPRARHKAFNLRK